MSKVSPCLWFDGEAEEAAKFYVSLLPDSRIENVQKNTVDSPAGKAGSVLVVDFTLAGQRFMALNGGKPFDFTHAISFKIDCADQAEVDRLWDALSATAGRWNDAAGSRIATAYPGKSCRPRSCNISAVPTAPARSGRCRRCWEWSNSTSPASNEPTRASRPPDPEPLAEAESRDAVSRR